MKRRKSVRRVNGWSLDLLEGRCRNSLNASDLPLRKSFSCWPSPLHNCSCRAQSASSRVTFYAYRKTCRFRTANSPGCLLPSPCSRRLLHNLWLHFRPRRTQKASDYGPPRPFRIIDCGWSHTKQECFLRPARPLWRLLRWHDLRCTRPTGRNLLPWTAKEQSFRSIFHCTTAGVCLWNAFGGTAYGTSLYHLLHLWRDLHCTWRCIIFHYPQRIIRHSHASAL